MQTVDGPKPVLAAILAIAILSTMDAAIKFVAADYGTWQIVTLRYLFGFLAALPFALPSLRAGISMTSLRANSLRGVIIVATAASFFFALSRLPLAVAVTLAFSAPIWAAIIGRIVLGERVSRLTMLAIIIGFFGIIIMVQGSFSGEAGGYDPLGLAAALVSAVGYSTALVLLRMQSAHDPVQLMVVLQTGAALLIAIPFGIATWTTVKPNGWLLFALIGTLGTAGHLILTWALARAPAARIATLDYSGFLWAVLFGIVLFGEWPQPGTYIGAALIISGCLIIALGGKASDTSTETAAS